MTYFCNNLKHSISSSQRFSKKNERNRMKRKLSKRSDERMKSGRLKRNVNDANMKSILR